MSVRILFLREGTSDDGIVPHIEYLAAAANHVAIVTNPDLSAIPKHSGAGIKGKLEAILALGGEYDLIAVHRDADNQGREARLREIEAAVSAVLPETAYAPIIPVRMTEAWLLVDEALIRQVAGNPRGRKHLDLPRANQVEGIADPKARLKQALSVASELTGRRLEKFNSRFSEHRRQILERLDPEGPVTQTASWRAFADDLNTGLHAASQS